MRGEEYLTSCRGSEGVSRLNREALLVLSALLAAAVALYWQSFGFAWTYDDFPVIVNNPDVQSFGNFLENSYPGRPLRELSFLLDHAFFGLNPAGFHLQQIFWHGLNAWLLYLLVKALGGNFWLGLGSAALFLVHPIQVEVVANISHRKDSLALAFIFLAVLAYIQSCCSVHRAKWFSLALGAWLVSLLAKENAVVVPVIWLLYEALFVPREQQQLLRYPRTLIAAVAAIGCGAVWYVAWGEGWEFLVAEAPRMLNKVNHPHGSLADYYQMVFSSWSFLGQKMLLPVSLAPEYVYPVPEGWGDPKVVGAIAAAVSLPVAMVLLRQRTPLAVFFMGWLGLLWLPTSNLWPLSYFAADRYWYAPSAGLIVVLLLLGQTVTRRFAGSAKVSLLAGVILLLSIVTWKQSSHWRDSLSLWTRAVAVSPESSAARYHLGIAYQEAGEIDRAVELFKSSALGFNSSGSYYRLALAYEELGDRRSALRFFCFFLNNPDEIPGVDKNAVQDHVRSTYGTECR